MMTYPEAVNQLNEGKCVTRQVWVQGGVFLLWFMEQKITFAKNPDAFFPLPERELIHLPTIVAVYPPNIMQPYSLTSFDALANDWIVVDEALWNSHLGKFYPDTNMSAVGTPGLRHVQ